MYNRCIFLHGESQNNAMFHFADEISEGLEGLGYTVIKYQMEYDNYENFCMFIETVKIGIDFIFSFNGQGFRRIDNKSLYEHIGVPLISILVDAPIYVDKYFQMDNTFVLYTCVDKEDMETIKKQHPNIHFAFLPHGGCKAKSSKKMAEREIDVLLTGTYKNECASYINDLIALNSPFLLEIYRNVLNIILKDSNISRHTAWQTCTDADPREYNFLMRYIDSTHRILMREHVLHTLLSKGVPITCIGEGWEASPFTQYSNFICKPPVDFTEAVALIGNAQICLNSTPTFKAGAHERIFTSMLSGTVCLTDENDFLKEQFVDGEDVLFYKPCDMTGIPEKIISLLNNEERLEYIANNAYNKVIGRHEWRDRAKDIIDIVNAFYD